MIKTTTPVTLFLALFGLSLTAPGLRAAEAQTYLFSYFTGNGEDGLHFARSDDGLNWHALRAGASFLRPEVGTEKLMRDPCILRGPDGVFRMVWTDSWYDRSIGYASSADLIHWSPEQALPVMAAEPKASNCWAPEVTYDPAKADYVIFWATTIPGRFAATDESGRTRPTQRLLNHRIYCVTTADFVHFSPTRLLYDGGFDVIDATMARDGSQWLMFVKNETERPKPEKNIRLLRAPSPEGPFSAPSAPITGDYWAEGPTSIRIGGAWYVYFDKYRDHAFGVVRSRDLEHWEDISSRLHLPAGIRHGTVFRVSARLADALE
ncbi:MAG TPA: glycoside hydrolase family 43 protein [Opitutaceae bacterium]|nr:glycoside hydrolase family 43 protein [Opitutaceae bacterium]